MCMRRRPDPALPRAIVNTRIYAFVPNIVYFSGLSENEVIAASTGRRYYPRLIFNRDICKKCARDIDYEDKDKTRGI